MNWLIGLLVVSLASVTILTAVLAYRIQTRWMRIFSESQGIPATIMENKHVDKVPLIAKAKERFSVPIPGGQMFRGKTQ